ncbi:HlyD family efflux transporter periplasmic adaptor subunit [Nitratireductor mangrovi]|uniref:HlyD family efflux transporter periplasmic adaptor subunit n=1 Tax=Nitratireductor mangrovi TaxID=2599600 RepID=A0A5B8KYX5_9HYPH|nr:HlyD family efflux transporter periplasmic adaptor subunit [Nitratireductor mangrovi]QDZ00732.1 HlyD family efflux transporter periplasmic adaptor subunit [Nitratireductor mangrovi]
MSLLCAIPWAAFLFAACAPAEPLAVGYVEGEYVLLAPIEVAQLREVAVNRGDRVAPGDPVARLEDADAKIAVAQAQAALGQAKAQLADLKLGKRPEEIAVLDAAVQSAEAQLREARRVLARIEDLFRRGIATQAQLDEARTSVEMAEAQLNQAEANREVAGLPARAEAIKAAENQVEQAEASLENARWRLSERTVKSPSAGRVDDVIRSPGDIAGPSAPVISMLPDGAVKLKLFVPEPSFAAIAVGDRLDVRCDGCAEGLSAQVSYVSPEPEFTPPVIYSLETRQKLVYLVEARPDEGAARLKPGQIVDVRLPDGGDGTAGKSGQGAR